MLVFTGSGFMHIFVYNTEFAYFRNIVLLYEVMKRLAADLGDISMICKQIYQIYQRW